MDIKIKNMYGDILGDYAIKNIMNYTNNEKTSDLLVALTKLLNDIKSSDLKNKQILIEEIKEKTAEPNKLKKYLESISSIASISSSITDVLSYLKI